MDSSGEGHIDFDEAEQGPVQEAEDATRIMPDLTLMFIYGATQDCLQTNQFQLKLMMKKKITVITVMMKLLMRMTMYSALNQF